MTMTAERPIVTQKAPPEAWTGIAFAVLFIASVAVSNPPADNASNAAWIANYSGTSEQLRHLATGILLVLAGLSFAAFITAMWRRIRAVSPSVSPLPLVTVAASAACIATGGVLQAFVSGSELIGKYPLPGPDILRLGNDLGFALVGVAGMLAAALTVACITAQSNGAGLIGRKMRIFGLVVAALLVLSVMFVPILFLLIWSVITAIRWIRTGPNQT